MTGQPFGLTVYVTVNTLPVVDGDSAPLYSYGCQGASTSTGTVDNCVIHINPTEVHVDAQFMHAELIHEMTHCFYWDLLGGAAYYLPAWFNDGSATWTAATLGGNTPASSTPWGWYISDPSLSLFQRTYDGVGFFAHLAETGTDPWDVLVPVARALASNRSLGGACSSLAVCSAGWNAARVSSGFLESWGPSFMEGRVPGSAWTTGGPGLPLKTPNPGYKALGDGEVVSISSVVAGAAIDRVDIGAQVVRVGGTGHGQVTLGHGADATLAVASHAVYCTQGSHCSCPPNTPHANQVFTPMGLGTQYLGVTGGLSAATATLTGTTLSTFCGSPDVSCLVGDWVSTNVTGRASNGQITGGGAGIKFNITPSQAVLDFDGMSPEDISTPSLGSGRWVYSGQEAARLTLSGSVTATSGDITVDPLPSADLYLSGEIAGKAIGKIKVGYGALAPASGTWTCTGDSAAIHTSGSEGSANVSLVRSPTPTTTTAD
ncbi:MAG TPA: hypothetical protein VMF65_18350 [Acidimicrobiales bacterium]|nr:hypothetical protein [Acidimicrobiales bacterium]